MGKISIADKYKGVDVKKVADICQRAYGLYEGNWVEVGPEEGCNNPTNEGKDRAIEMVGLLYHYLEPYNEQIRADYQSYKQLDLWERDRAYEDGWMLCWLDWACDIYDTHIRFMEELRAKYQPQQPAAPTVGEPQQMEGKKALSVIMTAKVKGCFDKAIEKGWMKEKSEGYYEWMGLYGNRETGYKQQLAFFCGYMYRTEDWTMKVGGTNMPTKELGEIFGDKDISKRLSKLKIDRLPKWSQPIKELVNSVEAS